MIRRALLICCVVAMTLVGCGDDESSYCDHGNRIYPNGVAANDPSCQQ